MRQGSIIDNARIVRRTRAPCIIPTGNDPWLISLWKIDQAAVTSIADGTVTSIRIEFRSNWRPNNPGSGTHRWRLPFSVPWNCYGRQLALRGGAPPGGDSRD